MEGVFMRTDKVIFRTILTTLAAILVLFGGMLLLLCFVFPTTMMQITYGLGMNKASLRYAERAYERTDNVYYAAFATEVAVDIESNTDIEKYGLLLIGDDEFAEYCDIRNEGIASDISMTYQDYVYGQVTLALYNQNKKAEAIVTATSSVNGKFPKNNAMVILFLTAIKAEDTETVRAVDAVMGQMQETLEETSADYQYISDMRSLLNG